MQAETPSKPERTRNPETHAAHRREVLWQIILPFILGVIFILGLVSAVWLLGVGDVRRWGDISAMWLMLPVLVLALIPLVILAAMVYGLTRLLQVLPGYARQVQDVFALVERRVRQGADRSVEPFLRVRSSSAALRALRRRRKDNERPRGN